MMTLMIALASTTLPLALPPRTDKVLALDAAPSAKVRTETPRSRCKPYFRKMSGGASAASAESVPCYQLASHHGWLPA
jgi:hypothetical protein